MDSIERRGVVAENESFRIALRELANGERTTIADEFLHSPWVGNRELPERFTIIQQLQKELMPTAMGVPAEWSSTYGSMSRQMRWLRCAYRIPVKTDEHWRTKVNRVWRSRCDIKEGLQALADLITVKWLDNAGFEEMEDVVEALEVARVPLIAIDDPLFGPNYASALGDIDSSGTRYRYFETSATRDPERVEGQLQKLMSHSVETPWMI